MGRIRVAPFLGRKPDEKLEKAGLRSATFSGVLSGMLYSSHACGHAHRALHRWSATLLT